jgi:hypothetical protein
MQNPCSSTTHAFGWRLLDYAFMDKSSYLTSRNGYFDVLSAIWVDPDSVYTDFHKLSG